MSAVFVDIDVDDHQAQEFFLYAGYKVRDMREPFREVLRGVILRNIAEQFITEGSLSGGWTPLTPRYEAEKAADGYLGGILERTLEMEEYLMGALGNPPWKIGRTYLEYEPTMDRVEWHQYGASRSRGGELPARPIITWSVEDDEMVERIFSDWLDELRDANRRRGGLAIRPDTLPSISAFI